MRGSGAVAHLCQEAEGVLLVVVCAGGGGLLEEVGGAVFLVQLDFKLILTVAVALTATPALAAAVAAAGVLRLLGLLFCRCLGLLLDLCRLLFHYDCRSSSSRRRSAGQSQHSDTRAEGGTERETEVREEVERREGREGRENGNERD